MSRRPSADELDRLFLDYAAKRRLATRNKLVEAHMGLAQHVAKRFSNRGVDAEDLRQVAMLALVKAVDRFDPSVGAAFSSFAGRTIEGEIKRHFRDSTWSVRVARSLQERHLLVRRATDELTHRDGRSPTARDIASYLDLSLDDVVEALSVSTAYSTVPIDRPDRDDAKPETFRRTPGDNSEQIEQTTDRVMVERLMAELPDREREIVRLRFFEGLAQSEIADQIGVSQMHVSRLLRRSLSLMEGWLN